MRYQSVNQTTASNTFCAPSARLDLLPRAAVNSAALAPTVPSLVHDVLRSPGQPLDAATRAALEPRFGHDFSGVRVHTDDRAAESARAVEARAYTVGQDVAFGPGQYAPDTSQGRRLLAHELAHVVQQGGDASSTRAAPDELEASARTASEAVVSGGTTVRVAGRSAPMLARDAAPPAAALPPLNVGDREGLLLVMQAVQSIKPSSDASGLYTLVYQGRTITLTQAQRDELSKTASKALADGLSKAGSKARFAMSAYKAQKDVDDDHYIVAPAVKFWGGVHDPGEELEETVSAVSGSVVIGRGMLARGDFQKAAAALADAEAASVKASRLSAGYQEDIISAGESQIKVLEFTRDASFVTLGVLAVIVTGGAAAGATTTVFGTEVGTVATANLIATAAPIAATVGGALTQVALGDKVDWAKVGVDIAVNLVLSRFGGKLSQGLFKVMLGNPAVRGLGALAFGRIVSSVLTHEVSTAFTTAVDAGYRKLRGQNVTWDMFTDDLIARLSDPKGVVIAAVMGAIVANTEAKHGGASEVDIADASGKKLGNFDRVQGGALVEEKSATGIGTIDPKTNLPFPGKANTEAGWAEKQIYGPTVKRINNLKIAAKTVQGPGGSPDFPNLKEIQPLRKYEFHIDADTPPLRSEVAKQIQRLQTTFPDWSFSAKFGK